MSIGRSINILILDDSSDDVAALLARLRSAGFAPNWQCGQTEDNFRSALKTELDLIFADTRLAHLSVRRVTDILRELKLETPLILLSDSCEEECGLEGLANETDDLVLKYRLDLLAPTVRRVLQNARDVGDRKKLQAELQHARQLAAAGRVAMGVAHDFNNLLMAVMMEADFCTRHTGLPPELRDCLNEIVLSVQHGTALARQLLNIAQPKPTQFCPIDLNQRLWTLEILLHRVAGEKTNLQLHPASGSLIINGDSNMIDRMVLNLVINARDAVSGHGRIVIETCALPINEGPTAGKYVCLRVSDTGRGISAEDLPRIFEPFFTTKENGQGTGLGLASVKQIIEEHKGFINVRSKIGEGTMFEIFIPESELKPSSTLPRTAQKTARGTETILLVDDHPHVRRLIGLALVRRGYNVLQASDAATALETWAQHVTPIDLLLTDVALTGGINGIDLAAQLQNCQHGLKVIFISAYQPDSKLYSFTLPEKHTYLQKPCTIDDLLSSVRTCLDGASGRARE